MLLTVLLTFHVLSFNKGMGDEELIQHLKDANLMTVFDRVGGLDVAVDWDW